MKPEKVELPHGTCWTCSIGERGECKETGIEPYLGCEKWKGEEEDK